MRSSQPAGGRAGDPPPLPGLPRLMAGGELQGPGPSEAKAPLSRPSPWEECWAFPRSSRLNFSLEACH